MGSDPNYSSRAWPANQNARSILRVQSLVRGADPKTGRQSVQTCVSTLKRGNDQKEEPYENVYRGSREMPRYQALCRLCTRVPGSPLPGQDRRRTYCQSERSDRDAPRGGRAEAGGGVCRDSERHSGVAMGDVPVLKPAEVVAILERLGFRETRQKGGHKQFRHADGRGTTVPFHQGRDISPILLRQIVRDIGMPVREFLMYR